MNRQTVVLGLAFLFVFGFAIYSNSNNSSTPVVAATPPTQNVAQSRKWRYARLLMDTNQQVVWMDGNLILTQQPVSLSKMIGLLGGGNVQPKLSNLLNSIGQQGWEFVWFNENSDERVWLFKKPG